MSPTVCKTAAKAVKVQIPSLPTRVSARKGRGDVAQLVERQTENLRVGGSNPPVATIKLFPVEGNSWDGPPEEGARSKSRLARVLFDFEEVSASKRVFDIVGGEYVCAVPVRDASMHGDHDWVVGGHGRMNVD